MAEQTIKRQADRTKFQTWFSDPVVAFFVALFWYTFKILPIKWASNVGGGLGWAFGFCAVERNAVMRRNLEIAFPDQKESDRRALMRRVWRNWGRFFAEMPHMQDLSDNCEVVNGKYMEEMRDDGLGGFICSAHIGNWEVVTAMVKKFGFPEMGIVYRSANNPWLDKMMFGTRTGVLIPKGAAGARKMLEMLRNKQHMAMLLDQKLNEGIPAPFFGKMAMSPSAVCVLSLKLNAPIYMARSIRQKDGRFKITFEPHVPISKNPDKDAAVLEMMTYINARIEQWIRDDPEQWLWMHRRFDKSEYQDRK